MSTEAKIESASALQASYVMCRTIRHAWFPFSNGDVSEEGVEVVSLTCERCGTKRHDYRYLSGSLYGRSYQYPENYKLSGEVTNDNLWEEFLIRRRDGQIINRRRPGRPRNSQ